MLTLESDVASGCLNVTVIVKYKQQSLTKVNSQTLLGGEATWRRPDLEEK